MLIGAWLVLAIRCCDQFTLQAFFSRNHTGAGSLIYIGMLKKLCNSPLLLQEVEWAAAAAAPGGGMGLGVPFNPLYRARSHQRRCYGVPDRVGYRSVLLLGASC